MRSQTITVGNLKIRYLAGGQGKPLLIIHGGGQGARAWRKNAESLSRNFRVYIPDLPGFGYSESANDSFHLPEFVDFVADFSQAVGIDGFYLMGHSIGGGIALHYALKYPRKVQGLVLISSWCLGYETALWIRFLSQPIFCNSFGEAGLALMNGIEWLVRRFHAPFRFDNPLSHPNMDIGMKMTNLKGQTTVLINRLSQLLMPTMLVWGSNDPVVPAHQAYVAGELIPDCEVHVFRGCGHSVYRERIEEFSQLLSNFVH